MTDYDVRRIARAVCEELTTNDSFMSKLAKMLPKERLLTTKQAADLLGVSSFTVRRYATDLGGTLQDNGRWMFHEDGLIDRYIAMKI